MTTGIASQGYAPDKTHTRSRTTTVSLRPWTPEEETDKEDRRIKQGTTKRKKKHQTRNKPDRKKKSREVIHGKNTGDLLTIKIHRPRTTLTVTTRERVLTQQLKTSTRSDVREVS
jgi:hypothetical protein